MGGGGRSLQCRRYADGAWLTRIKHWLVRGAVSVLAVILGWFEDRGERMDWVLGVLGGMGPLATVDFMHKLVLATKATRDQDHLPTFVYSVPQILDRTAAILGEGDSPFPGMLRGIRILEKAGAGSIAIPCNTAHFWHGELQAETEVPILHIADAVVERLAGMGISEGSVGLLATSGTVRADIYRERLVKAGLESVTPNSDDQEKLVMRGITNVKAGDLSQGRALLEQAVARLEDRGVRAIILGCTEVPLVLSEASREGFFVDATHALAKACVALRGIRTTQI